MQSKKKFYNVMYTRCALIGLPIVGAVVNLPVVSASLAVSLRRYDNL